MPQLLLSPEILSRWYDTHLERAPGPAAAKSHPMHRQPPRTASAAGNLQCRIFNCTTLDDLPPPLCPCPLQAVSYVAALDEDEAAAAAYQRLVAARAAATSSSVVPKFLRPSEEQPAAGMRRLSLEASPALRPAAQLAS